MVSSNQERQQKYRAKLKQEHKHSILVIGKNGEYDPRIRIALALQKLTKDKAICIDTINLIIKTSEDVMPTKDNINKKYVNKIVTSFLHGEN